jgi:hypothetical protein
LDKQPGDLVLHSLLARLVGPLDDDLEALMVLKEAGIEFGLDGAGGRGTGEAGQADFLRDAGMKFQHGDSSFWFYGWVWKAEPNSHPPSTKGSERRRRIHRHREADGI